MKSIFLAALALAVVVGTASNVYAQSSHRLAQQNLSPTVNYQDPETGKSYILTRVSPDGSTAPTTGTVKLTITFTVKSVWPTGAKPVYFCEGVVNGESVNESTISIIDYFEYATVPATVVGTAGSCTITIPYSWVIPAVVKGEIVHSMSATYSISAINSAATASDPAYEMRTSDGPALSLDSIPASGVTTPVSIAAVI